MVHGNTVFIREEVKLARNTHQCYVNVDPHNNRPPRAYMYSTGNLGLPLEELKNVTYVARTVVGIPHSILAQKRVWLKKFV